MGTAAGLATGAGLGTHPGLAIGALSAIGIAGAAIIWPWIPAAVGTALAFSVNGLVTASVVPPAAVLIQDYALAVAALVGLAVAARRRQMAWPLLAMPVVILLIVAIASAAVNGVSALEAILGVRTYAKYSLVYLGLVLVRPSERVLSGIIRCIVVFAYAQVPISVLQYVQGGWAKGDLVFGTLGWGMSGVQTVWLLAVIGLIYRTQMTSAAPIRWWQRLAPLVLFVPIALNETTVAFVLGPAVFAWLMLSARGQVGIGRVLRVVVLGVAAIAVTFGAYQSIWGREILDPAYVQNYLTMRYANGTEGRMRRLPLTMLSLELAGRSTRTALIGYGPGAASIRSVAGVTGSLYAENPSAVLSDTFFSRMTLELGLAGWAFIGLVVLQAVRLGVRGRSAGVQPGTQALLDTVGFLGIVQVPLAVYTFVWTADPLAGSFWVLAGISECLLLQAESEGPTGRARTPSV